MTAARTYIVGDQVAVVVTFTATDGDLETPTTFDAWYRRPTGEAVEIDPPTTEGTGIVSISLPAFDVPGRWRWGVAGTGGVVANVEGSIQVAASAKEA
jgi:hypothetical protein